MSEDNLVRKSPYEPGLYFVMPQPGTTLQSIGTTEWKVGERYILRKVLGYGSFSCVCLATDTVTGELVALKRIGDVLHSAEQAKRVLREIAILRRTSHPNLISLKDCFLRPSATGQCRMIGGRLVNCSIDLYIATEYADGGDLFHMRGQLEPAEVCSLLWQLLQALSYLHSMHVWHRDVKSQNAFVRWDKASGARVVKLGDFGSARSAFEHDNRRLQTPRDPSSARMVRASERSYHAMEEAMQIEDLYALPSCGSDASLSSAGSDRQQPTEPATGTTTGGGGGSTRHKGFKAPLTRVVATPCYRAPEVVMSRGGYHSAIDMWGAGCVLGELLQRVAYVGSAATPNLHVAPLFALIDMPKTPQDGETFGRPECKGTRRELQALFDVVGTPSWRDAAGVEMAEWRHYLANLPGKAPTLYRRFSAAGEPAVHLLSRLLDFDPGRRASCEEALAHEFFAVKRAEIADLAQGQAVAAVDYGSGAAGRANSTGVDAAAAAATQDAALAAGGEEPAAAAAAAAVAGNTDNGQSHKCWQESNPGVALALLEEELEAVSEGAPSGLLDPGSEGYHRLRKLLEAECAAAAAAAAARSGTSSSAAAAGGGAAAAAAAAAGPAAFPREKAESGGVLGDVLRRRGPGLQEDSASLGAKSPDYGRERLSNVADTWQGRELDPRKFLGPQRHSEWSMQGGGAGPAPGPRWGVTSVAPGLDEQDPRVQAIVKKQQER